MNLAQRPMTGLKDDFSGANRGFAALKVPNGENLFRLLRFVIFKNYQIYTGD